MREPIAFVSNTGESVIAGVASKVHFVNLTRIIAPRFWILNYYEFVLGRTLNYRSGLSVHFKLTF